jgi:hypothetical protein
VQKISKKELIGTMADSMGLDEHLSLNTILWMSSPSPYAEDKDSKINDKRDDVRMELFTAYRVLGNLSIKGNELTVECLSDKLFENCNNSIRLVYYISIVFSNIGISFPEIINAKQLFCGQTHR